MPIRRKLWKQSDFVIFGVCLANLNRTIIWVISLKQFGSIYNDEDDNTGMVINLFRNPLKDLCSTMTFRLYKVFRSWKKEGNIYRCIFGVWLLLEWYSTIQSVSMLIYASIVVLKTVEHCFWKWCQLNERPRKSVFCVLYLYALLLFFNLSFFFQKRIHIYVIPFFYYYPYWEWNVTKTVLNTGSFTHTTMRICVVTLWTHFWIKSKHTLFFRIN